MDGAAAARRMGAFGLAVDLMASGRVAIADQVGIFDPYLAVEFWAQMFLWGPLWDPRHDAWTGFLVMFAIKQR